MEPVNDNEAGVPAPNSADKYHPSPGGADGAESPQHSPYAPPWAGASASGEETTMIGGFEASQGQGGPTGYRSEPTGYRPEPAPVAPEPTLAMGSVPPPPGAMPYPVAPAGQPAQRQPGKQKAKAPMWVLPAILMALLLGPLAGGIAGFVAGRNASDNTTVAGATGSGGVIRVQERTAAPLPVDNDSIPAVADSVLPSTVQILADRATGSGWVYDDDGHIITNNHVIADAAEGDGKIRVISNTGKSFEATVVGRSAVYDLAVLKVKGDAGLKPLPLGSSQQMRVGETVVAVGSPLGLSASVTSGIVSAVDRPVSTGDGGDSNSYINAVQTDAAINPGNSGGPLVNVQGEVIGVNSAIATTGGSVLGDTSGNIGVGFAIPVEQVLRTATEILRDGKSTYPVIGTSVEGLESLDGARISEVVAGSPAEQAGIRNDDIVREVEGKPISGSIDLVVAIRNRAAGETITLTVDRGGEVRQIDVTLAEKQG